MNGMAPERIEYLGKAVALARAGKRQLTDDERADIALLTAPSNILSDLPLISANPAEERS